MRWMKRTIVVLCSTALGLFPARLLARTPNTDSTDVRIPTTHSEVENSIAVSPLNSKVLLLSNIAEASGFGGVTSWISLDAGKTWLTTDSLVLSPSRSDPAVAIGRSGGTNGRYFVNHLDSSIYDLGIHYKDTTGGTAWSYTKIDSGQITSEFGVDKNHLAITTTLPARSRTA
jgi:hypothetical protein